MQPISLEAGGNTKSFKSRRFLFKITLPAISGSIHGSMSQPWMAVAGGLIKPGHNQDKGAGGEWVKHIIYTHPAPDASSS